MTPDNHDRHLLRRYAEEHAEDAFSELVRRHLDGIYSSASRRLGGDAHLAKDVTQEVFLALAREAPRLVDHPYLTGWLYTTTRNLAANAVRTERRRKAREGELQNMSDLTSDFSAAGDVAWGRVSPVLESAIDELKETDRAAVLMRFIDRQSFAAIGQFLEINEEAARKRVDRSLEKLRAALKHRGIDSTTTALAVALTSHAVGAAPVGLAASITSAAISLAPSAAVTSAAATSLSFMSATKLTIGTVTLAGVIAAISFVNVELRARREAEASISRYTQAEAELLQQKERVTRELTATDAENARLQSELEKAPAKTSEAVGKNESPRSSAANGSTWDPKREGRAFLERHPDIKKVLAASFTASVRARYQPLFVAMGLNEDQIAQFVAIQTDNLSTGGASSNGKFLTYALSENEDRDGVMERTRALLGEESFAKFNEYQRMLPARDTAGTIAGALALSETPLSPAQADQLLAALGSNTLPIAEDPMPRIDWSAVLPETQNFLSPEQQAVVASFQQKGAFNQAISLATARARKNAVSAK